MIFWSIVLLWAWGFVLLWRTPGCPPPSPGRSRPTVSVIIPARNEERNLETLLRSLGRQTDPPEEILVADDGSTDDTAGVARRHGARVVRIPPLPDGWRGKTWACHHGARQASGAVLLFLDADTELAPAGLARMWAAFLTDDRQALSLGPYHAVRHAYEQLSAMFNLVTYMGMGAFSLGGSPDRPHGLFGPCLMIDRRAYNQAGGHAAVRGEILEHLSLGCRLRTDGLRLRCLAGRGVLRTRMYPDGATSLVQGWTKAFSAGATRTQPRTLIGIVAWMTGGMAAFLLTASAWAWPASAPAYAGLYLAYSLSLFHMLRRIGRFRLLFCLLYPLLLITFFCVFFRSAALRAAKREVTWKDRVVAAVMPEPPP